MTAMASQISDKDLGDAIIQSIEHGSFPQDEHVASAPIPATALPKLLEVVGKAREDTKVRWICIFFFQQKLRVIPLE
jgi:centromere/kinetochore protein ZW10